MRARELGGKRHLIQEYIWGINQYHELPDELIRRREKLRELLKRDLRKVSERTIERVARS